MKPDKELPPLPSQFEIIASVGKLFGSRPAKPRHLNAIIKAANDILAEFNREDEIADPGTGYDKWLCSDDTGMSSRYLAQKLKGIQNVSFSYPYDTDDFGRCYRMLRACPELTGFDRVVALLPAPWPQLGSVWRDLEQLYEEELPSGRAPKLYKRMKEIISSSGLEY